MLILEAHPSTAANPQRNDYDCGVFLIQNCINICAPNGNLADHPDGANIRLKIVKDICKGCVSQSTMSSDDNEMNTVQSVIDSLPPGSDELASSARCTITAKILKCLLPTRWLNDELINYYLELLRRYVSSDNAGTKKGKVVILDTWIGHLISNIKIDGVSDPKQSFDKVAKSIRTQMQESGALIDDEVK